MKTFRVIAIIATASLALVFTGCPKPETEPEPDTSLPIIKVANDTIEVDLGDKTAVLKDVTASDDTDGDITASIKITNENALESIGYNTIFFEVSDAAGNKATAKRVVMVKSEKLVGRYDVTLTTPENPNANIPPYVLDIKYTGRLAAVPFHGRFNNITYDQTVYFEGDGAGRLKIAAGQRLISGQGEWKISGEAKFESVDATKKNYKIVSMEYQLVLDDMQSVTENYKAVCVKR